MDRAEIITECKAINRSLSHLLRNGFPIQETIHTYTKFSKDKRNATPETSTESKIPDVPETMGNDLKSLKKKKEKGN